MKRLVILTMGLALLAGSAFAQVAGSPHDLSSGNATNPYHATNQDQICIFCHTPHHASATQTPLWNRSSAPTNYDTYWSATIDAYTQAGTPTVAGNSLLCLSCHDGTIALNSLLYYGMAGVPTMANDSTHINTLANLNDGSNGLTNDHPVSFAYADAISGGDTELVAVASLPAWALDQGNVECTSCHDVHNYGSSGTLPFLNHTKEGSAICLQCHVK